jgi:hypothetical protein
MNLSILGRKVPILGQAVDERFLRHRLQSTSFAGIIGGVSAIALFSYHYYINHVWNWDLFAIADHCRGQDDDDGLVSSDRLERKQFSPRGTQNPSHREEERHQMIARDTKRNPLQASAMFILSIGLLLPLIFHPAGQFWQNALHAFCGMCIGMSLVFSLSLLHHRCRRSDNRIVGVD